MSHSYCVWVMSDLCGGLDGILLAKNPNEFQGKAGGELNGNLPGSDMNGDRAAVREAEPCMSTDSVREGWLSGIRIERHN